jgi:Family of unknown function (DUF5947)
MSTGRPGVPLSGLRRVTRNRPRPVEGERCDMCAEAIGAEHAHVVDLRSRALMCSCRPCYLLFTDESANLNYRAVPERYLSFAGPVLAERSWDELQIPVALAFLFRNSVQQRTVAFYPGPAGATESELPLDAWGGIVAQNPQLAMLRPDVEALLIRRPTVLLPAPGPTDGAENPGPSRTRFTGGCYLVPIDACYELVGRLRTLWRGFDGGREARDAMNEFFSRVRDRSRPAPPVVVP